MLSIVVDVTQPNRGTVQRTLTKRSFVIGSSPACDLVIDDPDVERAHVRVIVRRWDHAIVIRPIDGVVRVNGPFAIEGPTVIGATDRVTVGGTQIQVATTGDVAPGKRWWDPRDWSDTAAAAPRFPIPHGNPPMIPQPPPEPEPPREILPPSNPPMPARLWNPPPPEPDPLPVGTRREVLSDDPTEHALLAALRDAPSDQGARMVYADWLEARDRAIAAAAVRGHAVERDALAAATTVEWRAIATCAAISGCDVAACPKTWQALDAARVDDQRSCHACGDRVFFVEAAALARTCARHRARVAIDPAGEGDALQAYEAVRAWS